MTPRDTARRLWALPGVVLTGKPRSSIVDGRPVVLPGAPLVDRPCPSFLIEHPRGLVLFDTGVSPKGLRDPERYFTSAIRRLGFEYDPALGIDAQLGAVGYEPGQVKYVIPSHLHFDHAGGLYLFPHATFLIGAGEMSFAYHPDDAERPYYLLDDLLPTRDFRWVEIGSDFDLFGDGSVVVLFSPGHTPGSVALFVRLPGQNLILTGDACHYQHEVEHGVADALHDHARGVASLRRLILIRDAWDATIWVAHDADQWNVMPHAPEYVR